MGVPKPQSRSERRKARTMAAILEAAERHLLARGHEDLRIDEIAADADVAVGSIYNHFGSKEGLELALTERAVELHSIYMEEDGDPGLSALERVLDTAGRLARFGREQPAYLRLLARPPRAPGDDPRSEPAARVARHLAEHERRTAALIEAAMRRGELRPLDARKAAAFLRSAWLGMLTLGPHAARSGAGGDARLRGVVEAGLRIVVGGLASDAARESNEAVRAILESAPAGAARGREPARGLALRREPVSHDLRAALPELALWSAAVDASPGPAPPALAERLGALRERLSSARATGVRDESTPWAYRVLARRLGVDPAARHAPVEEVALQRAGPESLESRGLPDDALLVAALETGVPILAFDADRLQGRLSLRGAADGERLGGHALAPGDAVIADELRPLAVLFGETDPERAVREGTRRIALAAIQAKGVPDVTVQEALWTAVELLGGEA